MLRSLLGLEVRLLLEAVHLRGDDHRELPARGVVVLHRAVVVLARDVDTVLRPDQLVLQLHEQVARTKLRVALLQREQTPYRPAEAVGRVNHGLLLLWRLVAALALRRRALRVQQSRARLRDLAEDLLLLHARRLRGGDEVGNKIGAAL